MPPEYQNPVIVPLFVHFWTVHPEAPPAIPPYCSFVELLDVAVPVTLAWLYEF